MANEINIQIGGKETVSDELKNVESSAKNASNVIVSSMGTSEAAFDTAARESGKLGKGLDFLSGASGQLSGAMDNLGGGLQAVTDFQNSGADKARELARKEIDVSQAMQDTQQAAQDLKQAQLDLNQSTIDGKQAQVDFEQSQIDQKQALVDASVAQKDYNAAVKEYGPNSDEAKQASVDLSQAQADLKQANLDSEQAIADQAQATSDGEQATKDMSQATIDAKSSQVDLNEAQSNAKPPTEIQSWTSTLGTFAPLVMAATGAIELMTIANTALSASFIKNTVAQVGSKIATVAGTIATGFMTIAQWALNAAFWANPITLIVAGILLLIGVIILIALKTTWFQDLWNVCWGAIKAAAKAVWDWLSGAAQAVWDALGKGASWVRDRISEAFNGIKTNASNAWNFITGLPDKLKTAFSKAGDFISAPFKAGFNAVAGFWNRTIGKLSWSIPSWVPGIGGNSISAPHLPTAATGADILRDGAIFAHKGERIVPASKAGLGSTGGNGGVTVVFDFSSAPAEFRQWMKKIVKTYGGGGSNAVQLTFAGDTV